MSGIIAVDLDGTLLRGNSFVWFFSFVFKRTLRVSPWRAVGLGWWLILRKMHVVSHRRLKWHLMRGADAVLDNKDYAGFASTLMQRLRPEVLMLVKDSGLTPVLATAASSEYVVPFVRLLGWNRYVATERPETRRYRDYRQCRDHAKVAALHGICPGEEIMVAVTDSAADIPLLQDARRCFLVNPSPSAVALVKSRGISFEILR